jgi:hypothetical protein
LLGAFDIGGRIIRALAFGNEEAIELAQGGDAACDRADSRFTAAFAFRIFAVTEFTEV